VSGRRAPRPWRAVAYVPEPEASRDEWPRKQVASRTAAKTRAGPRRDSSPRHRGAGSVIDVWELRLVEELTP
jgi:hypothetical protein